MKKIPTLFLRDFGPASNGRWVTQVVSGGCGWVLRGEGVATRKHDGTCVMLDEDGRWWMRREVKPGKTPPEDFQQIDYDELTEKTIGWEPAGQSGYRNILADAVANTEKIHDLNPGTFELCGPHVNGNPEHLEVDLLVRHGTVLVDLSDVERTFLGLKLFLDAHPGMEGIVFWRDPFDPDCDKVKIKARDFR